MEELSKLGDNIENFDQDAFAQKVAEAVKQGIVDAVEEIDWNAIVKEISSSNDVKLATAQVQLSALQAQKEVYSVLAKGTTVDAQKQLVNTSKSAYDSVLKAQKELDAGWTADFDGVITA